MALKNQIGLEGDVTPPEFVAGAPLEPETLPRVVLDWGWFKIERMRHRTYGPETQVHVTLPLPRRTWYSLAHDNFGTTQPALFVAFGMMECAHTGWHARGQIIPLDFVEDPVPEKELGYKNPIDLANY